MPFDYAEIALVRKALADIVATTNFQIEVFLVIEEVRYGQPRIEIELVSKTQESKPDDD